MPVATTIWLALLMLVPGIPLSLALYRPGRLALPTRLTTYLVFGFAADALVATLLTNLRVMNATTFLASVAVVTVACAVVVARRERTAGLSGLVQEARRQPVMYVMGLLTIVVIAIAQWKFSPLITFGHTESWRYWADAKEIAAAGSVPASTIQYGNAFPPTVSKLMLNAFNAGAIFTVGGSPVPAMGALTWLTSLTANLSLWSLGRELGLRYTAILMVVLTQPEPQWATPSITRTIVYHYNATYVGRMVAICAAALGIRALRQKRWKGEAVVVGVLFGVAAGTHLIPFAVFLALLGWYAVGYAIANRQFARPAVALAVIGVLSGGITLGAIATSRGDLGFQGVGGRNEYVNFPPSFDPTLFLAKGWVDQPLDQRPSYRERVQHGWYVLPGAMVADFVSAGIPGVVSEGWAYFVIAVALALGLAIFLLFPRRLRPTGVAALGFGATLIIIALAFSYFFETLVPAKFGPRRLDRSMVFTAVILVLALLEAGIWWLRRRAPRPGRAVGIGLVLVLVILFAPIRTPPPSVERDGRASEQVLAWMDRHIPAGTRILASRRSAGTFESGADLVGVSEGMTPYLRPDMLKFVIGRLLEERKYFSAPAKNRAILDRLRVRYVVFVKGNFLGSEGALLGSPNGSFLRTAPNLRLVYSNAAADVYEVARSAP